MDKDISVIIPTFNRKKILIKSLDALNSQTFPVDKYEVIVIDDGSSDGTEEVLAETAKRTKYILHYRKQNNKGPAAARNLGIFMAKGKIVLFLGDDIVADRELLSQHIYFHNKYPSYNIAVLGYATWDKNLKITPFMHWLENGGIQWKFNDLIHEQKVEWRYFYTANLSLKKQFLIENGIFDDNFPYATYEDSELGYRLTKKGLIIVHNKKAIGYHNHCISLKEACRKSYYTGIAQFIFAKKILSENKEEALRLLQQWRNVDKKITTLLIESIIKFFMLIKAFYLLEIILNVIVSVSHKTWLYLIPLEIFRDKGLQDAKNKEETKAV